MPRGPNQRSVGDPLSLFSTLLNAGPARPVSGETQTNPMRYNLGGNMVGGTARVTTSGTGRINVNGQETQTFPVDDLAGILGHLLHEVHGGPRAGAPSQSGDPSPFGPGPLGFLSALLNPANARAGDAVFTQEALDRVISNLMEQHSTSTAPGPASEEAIKALPKINISQEHLDNTGKAECSICMDNIEIGGEVTELPCKHWFHGDCVSAWLKEHDTCPQCRRGIMPKEGDGSAPRATGQAPRFWQFDPDNIEGRSGSTDRDAQTGNTLGSDPAGSRQNPFTVPDSPDQPTSSAGPDSRRNNDATSPRGGVAGWLGRRFHGSRGDGSGEGGSSRS